MSSPSVTFQCSRLLLACDPATSEGVPAMPVTGLKPVRNYRHGALNALIHNMGTLKLRLSSASWRKGADEWYEYQEWQHGTHLNGSNISGLKASSHDRCLQLCCRFLKFCDRRLCRFVQEFCHPGPNDAKCHLELI